MAAPQGADEAEPLALAAPTAAMSARLSVANKISHEGRSLAATYAAKLYLPTALVAKQLPAGLAHPKGTGGMNRGKWV
eukprot:1569902-Prymnesium_polylepis.1